MEDNTFNGKKIYTLTDIGNSLHSVISRTYTHAYYIKADIIKLNYYPRTGHCYPELVEKEGDKIKTQMRAVIWGTQFADINARFLKITVEPIKDGISILFLATLEFSAKYRLALYIQHIEPSFTLGEMARNKMEVIQKLKKENIFSLNKQKHIPLVPKRLAVISTDTSKGYSDFMITLQNNKRNFIFECQLFPSLLQGDKAVGEMVSQLGLIENQLDQFDCVVIIRGGGGDAGLNCYDHYELARRVAEFPIPVLSGIGHSTNETVTEMVSFMNKITPTEVAYYLIQKFEDFYQKIEEYQAAIRNLSEALINNEKQKMSLIEGTYHTLSQRILHRETQQLASFQYAVKLQSKKAIDQNRFQIENAAAVVNLLSKKVIDQHKNQIDHAASMLKMLCKQSFTKNNNDLKHLSVKLTLLEPANILKRGFSITYYQGKPVVDAAQLASQDEIETQFFSGKVKSRVE